MLLKNNADPIWALLRGVILSPRQNFTWIANVAQTRKRLVGASFGQYNKMAIQKDVIGQKTFFVRSEFQGIKRPKFSDEGGWGQGILWIIEVYFPQNGVQLY